MTIMCTRAARSCRVVSCQSVRAPDTGPLPTAKRLLEQQAFPCFVSVASGPRRAGVERIGWAPSRWIAHRPEERTCGVTVRSLCRHVVGSVGPEIPTGRSRWRWFGCAGCWNHALLQPVGAEMNLMGVSYKMIEALCRRHDFVVLQDLHPTLDGRQVRTQRTATRTSSFHVPRGAPKQHILCMVSIFRPVIV